MSQIQNAAPAARSTSLRCLPGWLAVAALAIGCASPFPAVLSSTRDAVAIEFEINGSLQEASQLAQEQCQKHGKDAEFVKVDKIATPDTRVAKYRCVGAESSVGSGGAEAEPEAAAD